MAPSSGHPLSTPPGSQGYLRSRPWVLVLFAEPILFSVTHADTPVLVFHQSANCDEFRCSRQKHVNSNPVARRPLRWFHCPTVRRHHSRFPSPRPCSSKYSLYII